MTHTVRQPQQKPSLSVRTRALLLKAHERLAANRRASLVLPNSDMRLRTRTILPSSSSSSSTTDRKSESCNNDSSAADTSVSHVVVSSASSSTSTDSVEVTNTACCRWERCGSLINPTELITHIQDAHVLPQILSSRRKSFTCRWQGCRVFRQPSVSSAWLEKHILHHTDAKGKPFCCIFDGCAVRFSTSILLERHVRRAHMRVTRTMSSVVVVKTPTNPSEVATQPSPETTTTQKSIFALPASPPRTALMKRTVRKRRRLKCYKVRRVDFYDRRSQCVIKNRLQLMRMCTQAKYITKNVESIESESSRLLCQKSLFSKGRRRSDFVRSSQSTTSNPSAESGSSSMQNQLQLALLLTTPHTIVGQRLSMDNKPELLVRWTGSTEIENTTTVWIPKETIQSASVLTSQL